MNAGRRANDCAERRNDAFLPRIGRMRPILWMVTRGSLKGLRIRLSRCGAER